MLRDVSAIDLSTELFGKRWAMPVGLGPVGLSGLYARRGEVQAAQAAAAADVPFALLDAQRLLDAARSRRGPRPLVPALHRQGPRLRQRHDRARQGGGLRRAAADRRSRGARARAIAMIAPGCPDRCAAGSRLPVAAPARLGVGRRASAAGRMSLGNLEPMLGQARALERLPWAGSTPTSTPASAGRTSSGCARNGTGR